MYQYRHFIRENIAPDGAKRIGVYNGDKKVCTIPLGGLTPPNGEKLYSFGLLSDIHLWKTNTSAYCNSNSKFDNALSYIKNLGCSFCVVSGDLTITGFYVRTNDSDASTQSLDEGQFAAYKQICGKYTIPVYALMGNHESYYGMPVSNNLALMETYTGKGELSYTVTHGNDVFILCGQNHGSSVMSDADFTWLSETLEANRNKRCFVFVHSNIEDNVEGGVEDSGNPAFAMENSIFGYWGAARTANFINLMKQYPNIILFHGHSHTAFQGQEFDTEANYSVKNGFKSVHVPSLGVPRNIVSTDGSWVSADSESQGYIVDVYDDCIVLNGWDFIGNKPVPLGVYKIDT